MKQIGKYFKKNKNLIGAIFVYLALCSVALPWYRHAINPDGVSYITIAQKYASGNFIEAVNGYWGPLLSWLLAPFVWMHRDPQVAARLLFIATGGLLLGLATHILKKWRVKSAIRSVFIYGLVPVLAFWAVASPITPDLFIVAAYLCYLILLERKSSYYNAVLIGCVAAVGYYSKAYFLPFFLTHFLFMTLYHIKIKQAPSHEIRHRLVALVAVALLIVPWIGIISAKYGTLSYTTSGSYNFSLLNPNKPGHPLNYKGLMAPPNKTALSAWEDPSYIPRATWSPFSSFTNAAGMVRAVFDNGKRIGAAFLEYSAFSLAICVYLVLVIVDKKRKADERVIAYISAAVVYVAGYMFLLAEFRYFWPVLISLSLIFCLAINQAKISKYKRATKVSATLILILSVALTPLTQLYYQRNRYVPEFYQSEVLKAYVPEGSRVAADNFNAIKHCFYLKARCWGVISPDKTVEENRSQLEHEQIDFVLITEKKKVVTGYLSDYTEVVNVGDVTLFQKKLF